MNSPPKGRGVLHKRQTIFKDKCLITPPPFSLFQFSLVVFLFELFLLKLSHSSNKKKNRSGHVAIMSNFTNFTFNQPRNGCESPERLNQLFTATANKEDLNRFYSNESHLGAFPGTKGRRHRHPRMRHADARMSSRKQQTGGRDLALRCRRKGKVPTFYYRTFHHHMVLINHNHDEKIVSFQPLSPCGAECQIEKFRGHCTTA